MSEQLSLDEALARVEQNADDGWKYRARGAIRYLCLTRETWISDDVWGLVEKPREARALGALVREALAAGWIVDTGRVIPSSQAGCHRMKRTVWFSTIWEGKR